MLIVLTSRNIGSDNSIRMNLFLKCDRFEVYTRVRDCTVSGFLMALPAIHR